MSTDHRTRAWIEVEASALRRNFRVIREAIGSTGAIIPMVKADAYGLGVADTVRCLQSEDPWGFGVATVEEGKELRALGVRLPVLVIGPIPPPAYPDAVRHDLTIGISDIGGLSRLADAVARADRPATFHAEIDTGMGRGGLDWRKAKEWGAQVAGAADDRVRWTGCFTHFHSADAEDDASLHVQWQRFRDALAILPALPAGMMVHACNSAAALRAPEYARDAVRPGIFLYGGALGEGVPEPVPQPVLSLRARIAFIREAPPGTSAGYGATHVAARWERWATAGIGYGDGLPRSLGNRGHALVRGRRVPIIGRISMDLTVVDITDIEGVEPGEVITFIGSDGAASIALEEVASHASTINYEILTGLTRRLPRIWIDTDDR